jgi:DNA-directed RNA polymerase subunit delta
MKIKALEGQQIEQLSMIEVAHAILEQSGKETTFTELLSDVQKYLGKSDDEVRAVLARFYTELNTDGSFIPLGDNKWGLRSWYAIDSIDEESISLDYFDEEIIDDTVDPALLGVDEEEEGPMPKFDVKSVGEITYDENHDDEQDDTVAYDEELAEVDVDADIPEDEVLNIDDEDDDSNDVSDEHDEK